MTSDFDFLQGSFEVTGQRLRDPFDADSGWRDVPATSSAVLLLDGAVSIDEMWFPEDQRFGMSLRLFDPSSRTWTVRWLTSSGGGLQPPVEGAWRDGRCWFTGPDEHDGEPILTSYSWFDVTATGASWEQCFSRDGGETWLPNWRMQYTRTPTPVEHPQCPRVSTDFDFLGGEWQVHHRRATDPVNHALGTSDDMVAFDGTHVGRTFFAGAVSVDEATMADLGPRGLTFRVLDPASQEWTIYWVNRLSGRLEPPVRGRFVERVGTFVGSERLGGHDVEVRFSWTDISPTTARWRQEFRIADGAWDDNWEMRFTRSAT